jgi:hypothetical protein
MTSSILVVSASGPAGATRAEHLRRFATEDAPG